MVIHTDEKNFNKEVLESEKIVFVDFYADWCGPCRITSPIIDEIAQEEKNIKFVKVNVDESPELANRYQVFSIPTFIIFKNGQPIHQFVGAMSKEGFLEEIEKAKNQD